MRLALEHMYAPVIHGALTTLLAVSMLAFSEFDFIVNYFFLVLLCLIGIGLINGIFFFPILLSLIGPSAEVVPNDHPDRISTPTPPPSPIVRRSKPPAPPRRSHRIDNARLHAEPSLTTITEEPNSWHSTQESCIIVQPEVKVETTSTCGNQVRVIGIRFANERDRFVVDQHGRLLSNGRSRVQRVAASLCFFIFFFEHD